MFSILHITDLHRSKTDPITNSELLSALVTDRDQFSRNEPKIELPDAIVVSGDLIQGVGLGDADFESEIAAQYDSAYNFLVSLTDRFLDGDRSKVVIIPGNHDVDWNIAHASMDVVDENDIPKNLPSAIQEQNSPLRWDWRTRRLYRIRDRQAYAQRLSAFWKFFERFYADAKDLLRVKSWSDANIYSLDQGRIGLVAFNSCVENDCFSFHGTIPREVVAQSHLDLKDLGPWRLRIAVWHHDIEGPPHRQDYMDPDIVRGMIGRGFRLGLYGHQHRPQITPQQAYLLDRETMAIASAGSLCAGRWELPTGARRGYSIVEIRDDYAGARVHIREMAFANLFAPAVLRDFSNRSYVDLEWTTPFDAAGRPEDIEREKRVSILTMAEQALRSRNDPREAITLLRKPEVANDPFGRRLIVEAAKAGGDAQEVIDIIGNPETIENLISAFDAYLLTKDKDGAESLLNDHAALLSLPDALYNEMRKRLALLTWKIT